VIGENGTDKMVQTDKLVTTFLTDFTHLNSIYISNQQAQISGKHTEEA